MGQGGLAVLEEAADGGVALQSDGDVVGVVRFAVCSSAGEKFRTSCPIRLIFGQTGIGGDIRHGVEPCGGTADFGNGESAVEGDDGGCG